MISIKISQRIGMLLEQLKNEKEFTNHEKDLAKYILEHLDFIPNMSSSELAQAVFTSKATVVRLAKKLGLSGYQEFRMKLLTEINQKNRIDRLLENEPITSDSSYEEIIKTLPNLYDKVVTNTQLTLNKENMSRIINYMRKAECIDLYGAGISYVLAQSAAFKFATLGVESSAYESINAYYLAARKHKKTIAFLISFTGANRSILQIAKYLSEATNHYLVGILGPHNEKIKEYCHEIVEIPNRDSLLSLDVISSFTGVNYVMDIFFSALLVEKYEKHTKTAIEMMEHVNLLWDGAYEKMKEE